MTQATTTLWHNPRCSKSRAALALLQDHGIHPDIRLYLEHPPTANELQTLLRQLALPARAVLRQGEEAFKQLNLANTSLSEAQLIDAMVAHPKLLERPIAVHNDQARIGRPPEQVLELYS